MEENLIKLRCSAAQWVKRNIHAYWLINYLETIFRKIQVDRVYLTYCIY